MGRGRFEVEVAAADRPPNHGHATMQKRQLLASQFDLGRPLEHDHDAAAKCDLDRARLDRQPSPAQRAALRDRDSVLVLRRHGEPHAADGSERRSRRVPDTSPHSLPRRQPAADAADDDGQENGGRGPGKRLQTAPNNRLVGKGRLWATCRASRWASCMVSVPAGQPRQRPRHLALGGKHVDHAGDARRRKLVGKRGLEQHGVEVIPPRLWVGHEPRLQLRDLRCVGTAVDARGDERREFLVGAEAAGRRRRACHAPASVASRRSMQASSASRIR